MPLPDLTALALNAAHQLPVAELHGAVCGLLVCHAEELPLQDLVELVGVEALTDQQAVEEFVRAAREDMQAQEMTFAPLLPADDVALEGRLEALGQWCGSFLAGLAAGLARTGVGSIEECPEEVREVIADFAAISRVDPESPQAHESGETADSAEADFVELEEFVKVGTLLIMTSFGSACGGSTATSDGPEATK